MLAEKEGRRKTEKDEAETIFTNKRDGLPLALWSHRRGKLLCGMKGLEKGGVLDGERRRRREVQARTGCHRSRCQ